MKDNRRTTGSLHRLKKDVSSVGRYGRKMVRVVSHREYGHVGTVMLLPVLSGPVMF